ncbi:hypothetical protein I4U23_028693 [Adineta vaga]|nr:hypothetical protein I4U23_028693 [Adineta vaga]
MHRLFSISFILIVLCASTMALSIDRPMDTFSKRGLTDWFHEFLSENSNKEKNSDSSSKLSILKKFLSSSGDSNGNLDKLFQILNHVAEDKKNESTSSSTKLDRLLGFFKKSDLSSSNNLQLAMKLMNLVQGKTGFSSFSASDLQSLFKFASG